MKDFYEWNKTLEKELETEMEKFQKCPTEKSLHNVKSIVETMAGMQELEAADAMRDYFEDEHGYDSRTGDFRQRLESNPYYGVYNYGGGGKRGIYPPNTRDYRRDINRDYDRGYDRDGYEYGDRDMRRDRDYSKDYRYMSGYYNHGDIESMKVKKLEDKDYEKWYEEMENSDGSTGGMWTEEETTAVAKKAGIEFKKFTPKEFQIAMDMIYSDYCEVAEKFNVDKPEFYACMAKHFLDDTDSYSPSDKLARYYKFVVKH